MTGYRQLITVDELGAHLTDPDWALVDCRHDLMQPTKGCEEYAEGHIPGAVYANLDDDLAGPVTRATGRHPLPAPGDFAERLGAWGIDNDAQVVAYDHASGAVAARLWWMLKWVGHERVAVLDGGYSAWRKAGLPISTQVAECEPAIFSATADSNLVVTTKELQSLIDAGTPVPLVDARDADRFAGRREPIDAVAGHIPGAVNYPFSAGVDEEGAFRAPEKLKKGWSRILGESPGEPWIAMCGSGVTACHLALTAELAGYARPCIYIGSWSEWITDPGRPVATGGDESAGFAADLR
jgi:thiosulfate/3-mercaptopyruvate sulfurtransferase